MELEKFGDITRVAVAGSKRDTFLGVIPGDVVHCGKVLQCEEPGEVRSAG